AYDPLITSNRYNQCTSDADCGAGRACWADGYCYQTTNYTEVYVDPARCAGAVNAVLCTSNANNVTLQLSGAARGLDELSDADWRVLRPPGRILTGHPYFWEAAADNALNRYLGWWHGGFELPGYEIAAVRQALAFLLRDASGDVRALEREILTSVLYT